MSTELKKLDAGFMALNQKVNKIEALLSACDPTKRLGHHDIFNKMLAEVEQRWEQDVKAVKRELHQTILAHNHNANLMADHKTTIDKIRAELSSHGPPLQSEDLHLLHEQLEGVTQTLERSQTQDRDVDTLLRRFDILMQHFGALGITPQPPRVVPPAPPLQSPNCWQDPAFQHPDIVQMMLWLV